MKYLALIIASLCLWTISATAQDASAIVLDPTIQQVVTDALPAKWSSYGTAIVLGIMILGRFITALANGRGIKGWISAIINGTNTPLKILIASLCLLTLPACTVDWQKAAVAATTAAAPIVLEGMNAKQPKNVQP
jgi:hypothetical protein